MMMEADMVKKDIKLLRKASWRSYSTSHPGTRADKRRGWREAEKKSHSGIL
jgi:hypothetical protein